MAAKHRPLRHLPEQLFNEAGDKAYLSGWQGTLESLRGEMKQQQKQAKTSSVEELFISSSSSVLQIQNIDLCVGSSSTEEDLDETEVLHLLLDLLHFSPQYRIQSISLSGGSRLAWSTATQRALRLGLECAELRRKDCMGMLLPSSVLAAVASAGGGDGSSSSQLSSAAASPQHSVIFSPSSGGDPVMLFARPQSAAISSSSNPSASFSPRRRPQSASTSGAAAAAEMNLPQRVDAVFSRFDVFFHLLRDSIKMKMDPVPLDDTDEGEAKSPVAADNNNNNNNEEDDFFADDDDDDADEIDSKQQRGNSSSETTRATPSVGKKKKKKHAVHLRMNDANPAVADLLVRILRHCSSTAGTVSDLPHVASVNFSNYSVQEQQQQHEQKQLSLLSQLISACPIHALRSVSLAGTPLLSLPGGQQQQHVVRIANRFLQPVRAQFLTKIDLRRCFFDPATAAASTGAPEAVEHLCRCLEQDNYVLRSLDLRHNGLPGPSTLAVVKAALIHPNLQQLLIFAGNIVASSSNSSSNLLLAVVEKFFGGSTLDGAPSDASQAVIDDEETEAEKRQQEVCLQVSKAVRKQLRRSLLDDPFRCEWGISASLAGEQRHKNNKGDDADEQSSSKKKKKKARSCSTTTTTTTCSPRSARTCVGLLCLSITQALQRRMEKVEAILVEQKKQSNNNNNNINNTQLNQVRDWQNERLRLQTELFAAAPSSSSSSSEQKQQGEQQQQEQESPHLTVELKGDVFSWHDAVDLLQFLSDAADSLVAAEEDLLRRHNPLYQQRAALIGGAESDTLLGCVAPIVLGATRIQFDGLSTTTTSTAAATSSSSASTTASSSRDLDVLTSIVSALTKSSSSSDAGGGGGGSVVKSSRCFAQSLESLHLGSVLWNSVFADAFEEQNQQEETALVDGDDDDDDEGRALREEHRQARRKQPVLLPYLDAQVWRFMRLCPNLLDFNFFPLRPPQQHIAVLQEKQKQQQQANGSPNNNNNKTTTTAAAVEALSFDLLAAASASLSENAPIVRMPSMSPSRSVIQDKKKDQQQEIGQQQQQPVFPRQEHGTISRTHGPRMGAPLEESSNNTEDVGEGSSSIVMLNGGNSSPPPASQRMSLDRAAAATAAPTILPTAEGETVVPGATRRRKSIVKVNHLARNNLLLHQLRDGGGGGGHDNSGGISSAATAAPSSHQHRRSLVLSPKFPPSLDHGAASSNPVFSSSSRGDLSGALSIFASSGFPSTDVSSFLNSNDGDGDGNSLSDPALLAQQFFAFGYRAQHLRKLQHSILAVLLSKQSNHALHRRIVEIVCEGAKDKAQEIVLEHHAASGPFVGAASAGGGGRSSSSPTLLSSGDNSNERLGSRAGHTANSSSTSPTTSPRRASSASGIRAVSAARAVRESEEAAAANNNMTTSDYDGKVRLLSDASVMSIVHLVYGGGLFSTVRSVTVQLPVADDGGSDGLTESSSSNKSRVAPHISWGVARHLFNCLGECTRLHRLDVSSAAPYAPQQPWARLLLEQSVAFFESANRRNTNTVTMKPFKVQLSSSSSSSAPEEHHQQHHHHLLRELQQRLRSAELQRYGTDMYRALLPLAECDAGIERIIRGNEGTSPSRPKGQDEKQRQQQQQQQHQQQEHQKEEDPATIFIPPPHVHGLLRQGELEELLLNRWTTRATTRWTTFALPHCAIGNAGAATVCKFLLAGAESCPPLRVRRLDLKNNMIRVDEECAAQLVAAVKALELSHVDLRENELTEKGLAVFFDAIVMERRLGSLLTLTLPQQQEKSNINSSNNQKIQHDSIRRALLLGQLPVLRNRIINAASGRSLVLEFTADCGDSTFDAAVRELAFYLDGRGVAHSLLDETMTKQQQQQQDEDQKQFHLDRVSVRCCHLTEKSLPLLVALSAHSDQVDWSLNRFSPPSTATDAAAALIRRKRTMLSACASVVSVNISGCVSDKTPQRAGALLSALAATEGRCTLVADGWCWDRETAQQVHEYEAISSPQQQQQQAVDSSSSSSSPKSISASRSIYFDGGSGALVVRAPISAELLELLTSKVQQVQHPIRRVAFCAAVDSSNSMSSASSSAAAANNDDGDGDGNERIKKAWDGFFSALSRRSGSTLESLLLSDCGMTLECGFRQLVQHVLHHKQQQQQQHCSMLSYLDISQNSGITTTAPAGAGTATSLLLETLIAHNSSLRFIDLSGCGFPGSVAELVSERIVAQWNSLGAHAKRDLAWIEQQQILSACNNNWEWFASLFPSNLHSHFASVLEQKEEAPAAAAEEEVSTGGRRPHRGAPIFLQESTRDEEQQRMPSYTICWSHGVGSDAAVGALCESIRLAVATATAPVTPGERPVPNFVGGDLIQAGASTRSSSSSSSFPFAVLDLSSCPQVTTAALEQLHHLVVDVTAATTFDACAGSFSSMVGASSAPLGGSISEGGSSTADPMPFTVDQPMHHFSARSFSSATSTAVAAAGAASSSSSHHHHHHQQQQPSSARSPDEQLRSTPQQQHLMQRPSSASGRSEYASLGSGILGSSPRQQQQLPRIPPQLKQRHDGSSSSSFFPLFQHVAVDNCVNVADFQPLVRICRGNRYVTASAASKSESPSRQRGEGSNSCKCSSETEANRARRVSSEQLDFISRCNMQPPSLRSLLITLQSCLTGSSSTASAPQSVVYFPSATVADVLGSASNIFANNNNNNNNSSSNCSNSLFSPMSVPASSEPMTDDACFLLQKLWYDSSSSNNAPSSSLSSLAQQQQQPFVVVHLNLSRNEITATGCTALADGLLALPPRLASLDLSRNEIGDAAASKVAALLLHQRACLKTVSLASNSFSDRGANIFVGCIQEMHSLSSSSSSSSGANASRHTALESFDLSDCPGVSDNAAHTVQVAASLPSSGTFADLCSRVLEGTQNIAAADLRTPSSTADIPLLMCVGVLSHGALLDLRELDFSNVPVRDEDLGWAPMIKRHEDDESGDDDDDDDEREEDEDGVIGGVTMGATPRGQFRDTEPRRVPMLFCTLLQKLLVSAPRLAVLDVSHSKLSVHAAARLFGEVAPFVREARLGYIGAFEVHSKSAVVVGNNSNSSSRSPSSTRPSSGSARPASASFVEQQPFVFGPDETEFLAAVCHSAYMAANVARLAVGPCTETACRAALAPFPADLEVLVSLLIRGKLVLVG